MTKYKAWIYLDGKARWVIKEDRKIINKNPNKEELRDLEVEPHRHGRSRPRIECQRIREDDGKPCGRPVELREHDKDGNETGKWICKHHHNLDYQRNNPKGSNALKLVTNCRTGNQNPNHNSTKGDNCIELACRMYRYTNLNKKRDNYTTEIDCQDAIIGLLHQIRGRRYNSEYRRWGFYVENDGNTDKEYEDAICYCLSEDGKMVERIYRIPSWDMIEIKGINIVKNPINRYGNIITPWYEKYRVIDKEELKKANNIWQKILDKEDKFIIE